MNGQVIAAIITGLCTIIAVVVSNELQLRAQDRRLVRQQDAKQAGDATEQAVILCTPPGGSNADR